MQSSGSNFENVSSVEIGGVKLVSLKIVNNSTLTGMLGEYTGVEVTGKSSVVIFLTDGRTAVAYEVIEITKSVTELANELVEFISKYWIYFAIPLAVCLVLCCCSCCCCRRKRRRRVGPV